MRVSDTIWKHEMRFCFCEFDLNKKKNSEEKYNNLHKNSRPKRQKEEQTHRCVRQKVYYF